MNSQELRDVWFFQDKFGMPNLVQPMLLTERHWRGRIKFLKEELKELEDAFIAGDMVKAVDALTDLEYVLKGTVLRLGLGVSWGIHWHLTHTANTEKERGAAPDDPGYKGLIKPPGWKAPDHLPVLTAFGYRPSPARSDDPTMPGDNA